MKSGVTVVLDKTANFLRAIESLVGTKVMVGVPAEKALREDGGAINNAMLAYIHEHGSPEAHIPPRPFLAPGIERAKGDTVTLLKKAGELALDGNPGAVERQLHKVGLLNQASVRSVITEGIPPPLAASTIAGRISRVKGKKRKESIKAALAAGAPASRQAGYEEYMPGLFTPLVVTGQLRNSIAYVLRKVKKS